MANRSNYLQHLFLQHHIHHLRLEPAALEPTDDGVVLHDAKFDEDESRNNQWEQDAGGEARRYPSHRNNRDKSVDD